MLEDEHEMIESFKKKKIHHLHVLVKFLNQLFTWKLRHLGHS